MKILCATDLFSRSDGAIERAGLLATRANAELSLLHVVAPTASEHVLEQELHLAISQMKSRSQPPAWRHACRPDIYVRAGVPHRLILETAQQMKADLIVLGAHRGRSIRDALEGTIAEKVLGTRAFPLLIVRKRALGGYRNVMLALDLSESSRAALRVAEVLGVSAGEGLSTALHVYEAPYQGMLQSAGISASGLGDYASGWKRDFTAAVTGMIQSESRAPARYDVVLEEGKPAREIVKFVQAHTPDVLVMGTRGGGRVHRALLGSVANEVMHEARCDVLIVPQGVTEEWSRREVASEVRRLRSVEGARGNA